MSNIVIFRHKHHYETLAANIIDRERRDRIYLITEEEADYRTKAGKKLNQERIKGSRA